MNCWFNSFKRDLPTLVKLCTAVVYVMRLFLKEHKPSPKNINKVMLF